MGEVIFEKDSEETQLGWVKSREAPSPRNRLGPVVECGIGEVGSR